MPFTVLTDSHVKDIFRKLSTSQLLVFVQSLEKALIEYSCRDGSQYQPHRGVVTRPWGQVSLFMSATTESLIGVKIVGIRPSNAAMSGTSQKPEPALKSALTLCDAQGRATGVLNAADLTAFRTALGSMLLFRLRRSVANVVVFGAGKQAPWHIELAMLLRGQDIRKITIVNRSSTRTDALLGELLNSSEFKPPSHVRITAFGGGANRDTSLEELVVDADAIFCTTPATEPLFPSRFLTSPQAQGKARFISAIGSYRLDMQEIDPGLLRSITNPSTSPSFPLYNGGVVAVDSVQGCMEEAGVTPDKMLEIGTILQERSSSGSAELNPWLEYGFVIYKSVGVGIMDLAIGQDLIRIAGSQNVGWVLDDF
ncbi:hypothetical protein QQX98_004701 [Neonectria punicea]|uniref:Ornithine cyclodeaminase n=1 Tax=Neonectria punicea TaxID=979145 RepID=A0ABR1H842_9HYPO